MILEFNQIGRQPNPFFEGKINGQVVITGKGATRLNNGFIFIDFAGNKYQISNILHREKFAEKTATQVLDILKNGKRVGYIYPDLVATKKVLFLSFGYEYFKFSFDEKEYEIYEVGLGKNQHYFCVYSKDKTVAIIHKEDVKHNYCDKYVIYALDDTLLLATSILTLYFDCISYPDFGYNLGESRVDDSTFTLQKELRDKYDADFIERVKKAEKTNKKAPTI